MDGMLASWEELAAVSTEYWWEGSIKRCPRCQAWRCSLASTGTAGSHSHSAQHRQPPWPRASMGGGPPSHTGTLGGSLWWTPAGFNGVWVEKGVLGSTKHGGRVLAKQQQTIVAMPCSSPPTNLSRESLFAFVGSDHRRHERCHHPLLAQVFLSVIDSWVEWGCGIRGEASSSRHHVDRQTCDPLPCSIRGPPDEIPPRLIESDSGSAS
jgi:hypothetical protein